ncbi:MAG: LptE family protein [Bacteroidota bacterium]|nr:LptE family protein [Bacteroidota bacterium]
MNKIVIGKYKIVLGVIALFVVLSFSGCGVYSFTGASISPEIKTVEIQYFPNRARLVNPTLSQYFTDALKDKFMSQTNLGLVNTNGDLVFEGEIQDYRTEPIAIQENQTAALNRLTIKIKVKFTNKTEPDQSFDMSFSQSLEYESSASLSSVEEELVAEINEALVEDIFNKAVVNW